MHHIDTIMSMIESDAQKEITKEYPLYYNEYGPVFDSKSVITKDTKNEMYQQACLDYGFDGKPSQYCLGFNKGFEAAYEKLLRKFAYSQVLDDHKETLKSIIDSDEQIGLLFIKDPTKTKNDIVKQVLIQMKGIAPIELISKTVISELEKLKESSID